MSFLDNDQFLAELAKLFQKSHLIASPVTITLTHYDGRTKPYPKDESQQFPKGESVCLFRAKRRKKKIRTVVHAKEVNKFQLAYASILKANIDNLKKRERKTPMEIKSKLVGASKKMVKV